ncbi:MAG: SPOR domain-containing protein [Acidobacteriaceae bacterium]|nr:SPOR domain-containing protein [Acidobacteriaceae bacterium]
MLQTSEGETEILLGNKQLLGIFCVVVILLGVAFAGGYKIGEASRKPVAVTTDPAPTATNTAGGQTHELPASSSNADQTAASSVKANQDASQAASSTETGAASEAPLGSRHRKTAEDTSPAPSAGTETGTGFTPQAKQSFLQVAAVGRDEAEAIADVLDQKGFHAHAVPKPGSPKIYRVLIGPVHDAADLNSTREALRKTGFREVIVQRY